MNDHGAPKIQRIDTPVSDFHLQPVAYADPKQYPLGIDVVLVSPGEIAPLGTARIQAGFMLAVLPPDVATFVRGEIRKAIEQARRNGKNGAGGAPPPGIGS